MSKVKINELSSASSLDTGDLIPMYDSATSTVKSVALSVLISAIDRHHKETFTDETTLDITHNLGKIPNVTVTNTDKVVVFGYALDYDALGDELNSLRITFGSSESGTVVLN